MPFESIDPTTENLLERFDTASDAEIDEVLARAERGFAEWKRVALVDRGSHLHRLADALAGQRDELSRLMTLEMGKPIFEAEAEIDKCAWVCRYYADIGHDELVSEQHDSAAKESWVAFRPLGAILAIMPWNFPFWQAIRCAAPALKAGNVMVLKHAPNVPQCARAVTMLFAKAFPEGVFQNVYLEVDQIPRVLDHPTIQGASFTGSVEAGSSLAAAAASRIKKTVLELGGSDPFIVMESADLERAVETAVTARMINNGQSCIAAKRMLIHEPIADEFEERFVRKVANLEVGDPQHPDVSIGPLAREDLRDRLADQVERSLSAGARAGTGGRVPERSGWFYEPTVLTEVPDGCPASEEELFGPVASLFRVADIDEAIARANDTEYGLSSAIWTRDPSDWERAIDDIEAGAVFVNGMSASDPRLPFGGVKRSGYGRELGPHALREFVNVQTVWLGEGT